MLRTIIQGSKKVYSAIKKYKRIKIEREKLKTHKGIQDELQTEKKKPVAREFLELHYPYLLDFVRKESESIDFLNIQVAMGARYMFNLAIPGETPYFKLNTFNKNETFPATTLDTLRKVLLWESLSEDLTVDRNIENYLIARKNYVENRDLLKDRLIRTVEERPRSLFDDIEEDITQENRDEFIKALKSDPEAFVEDVLKNKSVGMGGNIPTGSVYVQHHDQLLKHIRSYWLYEDDFTKLEQNVGQMQSNFEKLYAWGMMSDHLTNDNSLEKEEYGLLIQLHEELLYRYKFTENMLDPIDPDEVPASDAEEYYSQTRN